MQLHVEPMCRCLHWQIGVCICALPGPYFREACTSQGFVSLCRRILAYDGFSLSKAVGLRHAYWVELLATGP